MKRAALVLLVNVAVFCVLAELLALGIFYYQHGWLFYLDPYRQPLEQAQVAPDQALTAVGLHPYFGPTHRPGIPFDIPESMRGGDAEPSVSTNNFGFASKDDYPFTKTSDRQFVVGIFGGSVAAYFCRIGAPRLQEDLRQQPFFSGRDIIPLCFSHEGYKQPQQLLVLAYFLSIGQQFDAVINIDGFNEVALGRINDEHGWDISMPSHEHLDPLINLVNQATLTPAKLELLSSITRDRARLNAIAARDTRAWSAAVDFGLRRYYEIVRNRYQRALVQFDALPSNPPAGSAIHVTPAVKPRSGDALFADIASDWSAASLLMKQMLGARGVSYVHVLQPNQYYTSRRFSEGERRVALNDASPFKAGAARGYPFLEKALEPGAINALHAFDTEREPMYVDDCCHYTYAGNRVLADVIANAMRGSTGGR